MLKLICECYLYSLLILSAYANANAKTFVLVDKVCGVVGGSEDPILLSELKTKAKNTKNPLEESLEERALWVYAKQSPKFNVPEIKRMAQEHPKSIEKSHNLTPEQLDKILKEAPYNTTRKQFINTTGLSILKNQIEASLAGSISDKEIEEAAAKIKNHHKEFDVAFITITPKPGQTKAQLQSKANIIRKQVIKMPNLTELKRYYEKDSDIQIGELLKYESGSLQAKYEQELRKNPKALVTDIFDDGNGKSMILKIEAPASLENVRKELYNKKIRAIAQETLANTLVVINCERGTHF